MRRSAVAPVVDQVQFNPFDVALEAYSPLRTGRTLTDEGVKRIAERVGRTPAQVLLRWCTRPLSGARE